MKKYLVVFVMTGSFFLVSLTSPPQREVPIGVEHTLDYFKTHAVLFAKSTEDLQRYLEKLNSADPSTICSAKESLQKCRMAFKNIEFFFNYFFRSLTIIYNSPPVVEVEEPYMECREPTGLQVIAGLLFSSDPLAVKKELLQQVSLVNASAQDVNSLLYNLPVDDRKILESIRLELVNVITLGIAGFDAPELKTGIKEAGQTLSTIKIVLSSYLEKQSREADSVSFYLNEAIRLTESNSDFDSFDRLNFLTEAALPLQYHLKLFIQKNGLELNTTSVVNYASNNIFSPDAININGRLEVDTAIALLGKKLFFENALSGNNTRSCATCHQPEKYFTDGLPKSITLDGHSTVQRNSPTLLYSSFQYSQFWDGRVKNLEDQIKEVLRNPFEMNGDYEKIVLHLQHDDQYIKEFENAFPESGSSSSVNIQNAASAIAAYLKTLSPFDSPFDKYLKGDKKAMNKEQVNGFNLFMGKALCGTCHVAPLFNGLTPPFYDRTTTEVIGTTSNINFSKAQLDSDSGRFTSYPIEFYMRSFKTPCLRNVAQTAPYMHNGAFSNLESTLEFYNKGGGKGLGLEVPHQTLSSNPLKLEEKEVKDIITFLHSLTDSKYQ